MNYEELDNETLLAHSILTNAFDELIESAANNDAEHKKFTEELKELCAYRYDVGENSNLSMLFAMFAHGYLNGLTDKFSNIPANKETVKKAFCAKNIDATYGATVAILSEQMTQESKDKILALCVELATEKDESIPPVAHMKDVAVEAYIKGYADSTRNWFEQAQRKFDKLFSPCNGR